VKIRVIEKEQDDKKKTVNWTDFVGNLRTNKEKELSDTVDITDTIKRMGDRTYYSFNSIKIKKVKGQMIVTTVLNNKDMYKMTGLSCVDFDKGDIISIEGFNATSDVTMSWDN